MTDGGAAVTGAGLKLQAEGLGKRFGWRRVFRGLSLEAERGSVLVVRGSNGSGKSTLLRILAGLLRPTEGTVRLETDVPEAPPGLRCRVALAAPSINPYARLTLAENIQFFLQARGASAEPGQARRVAGLVGLEDRLHEPVGSFSSGMTQRVRLALAAAAEPDVLLLDEPSHCLDEDGRRLVREIVERQACRGICVLATNDEREAELGARHISMDDYRA